jgi:hypothetical protein
MTRSNILSTAMFAAALTAPSYARADVPPPPDPPNPCDGKSAGDACGTGGVCQPGECCKTRHVSATLQHYESRKPLDQQDPDIVNPPSVCKPCLKCEWPAVPAAPPVTPEAPRVVAEAPAPAPAKSDSMCTVVPRPGDAGAAGMLLATLLYTRRRSRRP